MSVFRMSLQMAILDEVLQQIGTVLSDFSFVYYMSKSTVVNWADSRWWSVPRNVRVAPRLTVVTLSLAISLRRVEGCS